jgi:hypothetical protein
VAVCQLLLQVGEYLMSCGILAAVRLSVLRYVANEGLAFLWVDPESGVMNCLFYGGEALGLEGRSR